MLKSLIFTILFLAVNAAIDYENVVKMVNMDDQMNCGKKEHVIKNQKVTLHSSGKSGDGIRVCDVTVHAHGEEGDGCEMRQLCVKVDKLMMEDCNANLTIMETLPGGRPGQMKKLRCGVQMTNVWCTLDQELDVQLRSNFTTARRDFSFNVTISHSCVDMYEPTQIDQDAADNHTRVLGIITGLCCCSIFLVALVIAFCCFRSKGWRHQSK